MRCESKGGAIMGKETVKNTYVLKTSALFRLLMKLLQLSHLWPLRK